MNQSRASIFFGILLFLLFSSTGGALYAGVKTGAIEEKLGEPIRQIVEHVGNSLNESVQNQSISDNPEPTDSVINVNSEVNIHTSSSTTINGKKTSNGNSIQWVYPTLPANGTYEQNQKAVDAWWAQIQAENIQKSAASQKALQDFQQQSQQNLEQFKQQGQQGMQDFKKQMEEQQKQFLLDHGITPTN